MDMTPVRTRRDTVIASTHVMLVEGANISQVVKNYRITLNKHPGHLIHFLGFRGAHIQGGV